MKSPLRDDAKVLKKTPIQGRSQRTMDTLLEAAAQFIERDEEDQFNTNRIAERAGFSIGTLYQYFPNKEAIILALARRGCDRFQDEIAKANARALAGGQDIYEIVRANIHDLVETFGRGPSKKRWLARLVWRLESPVIAAEFAEASAKRIANDLRRADDTRLRETNPAQLFVMTRAVQGVIRAAALEDSALLDDPGFEEELVRMAWNMLLRDGAAMPRRTDAAGP